MNHRQEVMLIEGKPLQYRVRRNRRARRFTVQVSVEDGVVVTVPRGAALKDVPEMMAECRPWLLEKLQEHDCWSGPRVRQYASGSEILYLGDPYRLEILPLPSNRSRAKIETRNGRLVMMLSPEEILRPRIPLERWLRREAKHILPAMVQHWSEEVQLYPGRVIIGERKTRWGSCSARGTLSFCYRLIMTPSWVIDALVVHELCHLRYMNHGPRFYALLEHHCPDHREAMSWLKDNHGRLQL